MMGLTKCGGRHFQPCRKCDYLFNHTSGKVSGGTEGEALCVKKMISWEQRKGGYESVDL